MENNIPKKPIPFFLYVTRPYKWWAIVAMFSVLGATGMGGLLAVLLSRIIDGLVEGKSAQSIFFLVGTYAGAYLLTNVFYRTSGFTGMRWFTKTRARSYQLLYAYILGHSREYFDDRFAGALSNKISNVVEGTQSLFNKVLWTFSHQLFLTLWIVLYTGFAAWYFGAIILAWGIVIVLINLLLVHHILPHSIDFNERKSGLMGHVVDTLTNIGAVQQFANTQKERANTGEYIENTYQTELRGWIKIEWALVINGLLMVLFVAGMVSLAAHSYFEGLISIGSVVLIVAAVARFSDAMFFLGVELTRASQDIGQAQEGLNELLMEHTIKDVANAKKLSVKKGEIAVENLKFSYGDGAVLEGFNVNIKSGQKVGLVGRSGAGKSTLVSLLLRQYDIGSGSILIDGQNITEASLDSLRSSITLVPQDTTLFHRSVFENIAYARDGATRKEVIGAAKKAHAHEFIESLEKKYETMVGERGVKLSGGQRQRVAIARAFLKDSPILILDEATSSLDSESEQLIQKSFSNLMANKTVIAIAHRLSTLRQMDRIIVIDKGVIVEDGAPADLLEKKRGVFKTLWDHQSSGFIHEDE